MKTVIRRYDINGAWTHDEEIKDGVFVPKKNSMWRIHKLVSMEAVVTLKGNSGNYNTRTYYFKDENDWNDWCALHHRDHSYGKIIGIHEIKRY